MAEDDWREDRRDWRGGTRYGRDRESWSQDDAPQFDRWGRDRSRLGYGPYARDTGPGLSRSGRSWRDADDSARYPGQGYRARAGEDDRDDERDRFRSGRVWRGSTARDYRRGFGPDDDRGWMDRAGDEVASWFGDDEAEYRRRMDRRRDEAERYTRRREDELSSGRPSRRWRDDW